MTEKTGEIEILMTEKEKTIGRRFILDASMTGGGGGHTFVLEMVPQLAKAAPDDQFRLFTRNRGLAEALPDIPNLEIELLPECGLAKRMQFIYVSAPRIAREWKADCYFSFAEYAPVTSACPVIATFQNPNIFDPLESELSLQQKVRIWILYGLAHLSALTSERVYFVSQASADEIGESMGIVPHKRAPICHGINASEWKPTENDFPVATPYILSVSSIYHYKNFVKLIEAYGELARRRLDVPDLVIVGDNQDQVYAEKMEAARVRCGDDAAARIHIVGKVSYADIKQYYHGASLFVFPSYRETFGIPLIEAMASEVPLVVTDMPVFREIAGDAALYIDPDDKDSFATAMESILYSEQAREILVKRGRERVKHFTWERAAAEMKMLLHDVTADSPALEGRQRIPGSLPLRPRPNFSLAPHSV